MSFWSRDDSRESLHHTGSDCYKYVDRLIKSSGELMMVSPFVDKYYAEFLRRNSRHKKILLLSSSIDRSAQKALGRRPHPLAFAAMAVILAVLCLSEYYAGVLTPVNILASAFLISVLAFFLLGGKPNVDVRRPEGFVHMKLYLSERQAIQGSANLTYSGMHRNVEHIEVINNPEVIDQLREDFLKLWARSI